MKYRQMSPVRPFSIITAIGLIQAHGDSGITVLLLIERVAITANTPKLRAQIAVEMLQS